MDAPIEIESAVSASNRSFMIEPSPRPKNPKKNLEKNCGKKNKRITPPTRIPWWELAKLAEIQFFKNWQKFFGTICAWG